MNLRFQVVGVVERDESVGVFVAKCRELDVCSQGRTEDEAKVALEDALDLYVKHCIKRGILFDILKARGIGVIAEEQQEGPRNDKWAVDIDVPLGALVADAHNRGTIGAMGGSWRP